MEFWSGLLWRGDWVSGSGQYYRVPELLIEPHPRTPAPILCERFADKIIAEVRT